jgi:hypothetical protein
MATQSGPKLEKYDNPIPKLSFPFDLRSIGINKKISKLNDILGVNSADISRIKGVTGSNGIGVPYYVGKTISFSSTFPNFQIINYVGKIQDMYDTQNSDFYQGRYVGSVTPKLMKIIPIRNTRNINKILCEAIIQYIIFESTKYNNHYDCPYTFQLNQVAFENNELQGSIYLIYDLPGNTKTFQEFLRENSSKPSSFFTSGYIQIARKLKNLWDNYEFNHGSLQDRNIAITHDGNLAFINFDFATLKINNQIISSSGDSFFKTVPREDRDFLTLFAQIENDYKTPSVVDNTILNSVYKNLTITNNKNENIKFQKILQYYYKDAIQAFQGATPELSALVSVQKNSWKKKSEAEINSYTTQLPPIQFYAGWISLFGFFNEKNKDAISQAFPKSILDTYNTIPVGDSGSCVYKKLPYPGVTAAPKPSTAPKPAIVAPLFPVSKNIVPPSTVGKIKSVAAGINGAPKPAIVTPLFPVSKNIVPSNTVKGIQSIGKLVVSNSVAPQSNSVVEESYPYLPPQHVDPSAILKNYKANTVNSSLSLTNKIKATVLVGATGVATYGSYIALNCLYECVVNPTSTGGLLVYGACVAGLYWKFGGDQKGGRKIQSRKYRKENTTKRGGKIPITNRILIQNNTRKKNRSNSMKFNTINTNQNIYIPRIIYPLKREILKQNRTKTLLDIPYNVQNSLLLKTENIMITSVEYIFHYIRFQLFPNVEKNIMSEMLYNLSSIPLRIPGFVENFTNVLNSKSLENLQLFINQYKDTELLENFTKITSLETVKDMKIIIDLYMRETNPDLALRVLRSFIFYRFQTIDDFNSFVTWIFSSDEETRNKGVSTFFLNSFVV